MRTANTTLTWAGALTKSVAATATGDPFPVKNMTLVSVTLAVTGGTSPTGTFKLQGCNDAGDAQTAGAAAIADLANWADIANATSAITTNGVTSISVADLAFRWVRVVFTYTSGTGGTVTARAQAKGWD